MSSNHQGNSESSGNPPVKITEPLENVHLTFQGEGDYSEVFGEKIIKLVCKKNGYIIYETMLPRADAYHIKPNQICQHIPRQLIEIRIGQTIQYDNVEIKLYQ